MRLIDADSFWTDLCENAEKGLMESDSIEEVLNRQPTIESESVRHGFWNYVEEFFADRWWNTYQCTVCGHQEDFEEPYRMKYCPECGAKMDEVWDETNTKRRR